MYATSLLQYRSSFCFIKLFVSIELGQLLKYVPLTRLIFFDLQNFFFGPNLILVVKIELQPFLCHPFWPCLGFEHQKPLVSMEFTLITLFYIQGYRGPSKLNMYWTIRLKNPKKLPNWFQNACSTGLFDTKLPHILMACCAQNSLN